MILAFALALALGPVGSLDEAAQALASGRLAQASEMIAAARASGVKGDPIERLEADLALASGATIRALEAYRALILSSPNDPLLLERAGQAALRLGRVSEATRFLDRATLLPTAGWRAWNLRGVAADRRGDFDEADAAYAKAVALAPKEAAIINNLGWSQMLRGRWIEAENAFAAALALDPRVAHGAANLELARAAVAGGLPERRSEESDVAFAARLNDAGVVAAADGDRARAVAAFTRAIDTRSQWFDRAALNLEAISEGQQ